LNYFGRYIGDKAVDVGFRNGDDFIY